MQISLPNQKCWQYLPIETDIRTPAIWLIFQLLQGVAQKWGVSQTNGRTVIPAKKNNAENQRCDLSQRYRAIKPDTKFHSHNSHTKSHDISFSAYHTKVAHTSFSRPISIGWSVSNAPDILIGKHQRMAKRTSDSTQKTPPVQLCMDIRMERRSDSNRQR